LRTAAQESAELECTANPTVLFPYKFQGTIKVCPRLADIRRQGELHSGEQTHMEIGPIPGVRMTPMVRSKDTDLGMTDIYEVERSTRTGDETYTPSHARAATGYEDDEDKYNELEDDLEAAVKPLPKAENQISRFA
jgi:hypothetical protein